MNGAPSLLRGEGPPSQGWGGSQGSATALLCRRGVQRGVSGSILSASAGSQGHLRVQTVQMSPGPSKEAVRTHMEQGRWAKGMRGGRCGPLAPPGLRPHVPGQCFLSRVGRSRGETWAVNPAPAPTVS